MKHEHLIFAANGNRDAVAFLGDLWRVTNVWDDLIDNDKAMSERLINEAFWTLFVSFPTNPFYQKHVSTLFPLMQNGILTWYASNRLPEKLSVVPACAGFTNVVVTCAFLTGGLEHSIRTAELCWTELIIEQQEIGA